MSAIDGFAHAAKRLMGGAINGAIGGAYAVRWESSQKW